VRNRMMLGRFMDVGSRIHRLDPRAKIIALMIYTIVVFRMDTLREAALVSLFSLGCLRMTRIGLSQYVKAVRPLGTIVVFIFLCHLALDAGGNQLWRLGPFSVYSEGLERGLMAALRMIWFVAMSAVLTFTTPPAQLIRGLERVLAPLRRLGLRPQNITLMLMIAFRFVPTIFAETERILKAQASRGFDLKGRPWKEKAGLFLALLVPVTVNAIRRGVELAESMETRGFRPGVRRSCGHALIWRAGDTAFVLLFAVLLAVT